jgi:hypothetical protein
MQLLVLPADPDQQIMPVGLLISGSNTITWTVTDASGNTQTCQTTVIINAILNLSNSKCFALSSGNFR